jgi:hypothetical protein
VVMDGATDAVSTHVVGIGMRMDRAVGIAAVIETVEIASAVTVARVTVVAVIGVKYASGQIAAADAVVIAMEIGGHAAIDPAARKRKGIVARVRDGAMEVGVTATVAIPTGLMAIALRADVLTAAVATVATAAMEIVRRADVQTATVQTVVVVTAIAASSIVTPTVEATPLARTSPNRLKAFVRMTQAIVSPTLRSRWPAARVMLA